MTLSRYEYEGATLWQLGGRRRDRIKADGTWDIQVAGGQYACRTSERQAVMTCGECHQQAIVERRDGQVLTDDEIVRELRNGIEHQCTAPTPEEHTA